MFDFLKKALSQDFFLGACDMHCHLLPGVDDGFQTMEDALEALRILDKKGVKKMYLTPHFMKEYPNNVRETIEEKFQVFQEKAAEVCHIELRLAAEHMLDSRFMNHFENKFLTLGSDDALVLCETSYMMSAPNAKDMLYQIMLEGYQPIIAHPERYQYASKSMYERWKDRGYLFQLNLLSLGGAYGTPAMRKSHYMLSHGMYDYIGSDMHRLSTFEKFIPKIKLNKKEMAALRKLYENNATLF